jgi:hypothetical protein
VRCVLCACVIARACRHVHAVVLSKFGTDADGVLSLTARANAFSCYVLLVGSMSGADVFTPTHA